MARDSSTTDVVLGQPDVVSEIFVCFHIVDLARASATCRAFLTAAGARLDALGLLSWERTLRGRDPSLSSVGFYFHRHGVPRAIEVGPDSTCHRCRP